MHRALRTGAPLALLAAALLGLPAPASAAAAPPATATAQDLPALQASLQQATDAAAGLAGELEREAARAAGLRTAVQRLAEQREAARAQVDARARQAYLALQSGGPAPLAGLVGGLAAPDLRRLADAELARRGAAAAVRSQAALADAVGASAAAAAALDEQAAAYRAGLQERADRALTAQDQARRLLSEAERAVARAQAEEQARAADARQRAAQAEARAALTSALVDSRSRLDAASAVVTRALTPAQTARSRGAAAREAPLVLLVEAAGAGLPAGYRPTGQVLRGEASWYGPGFVGRPTASGAPYDPERLTCAHKSLPLGTVVRVVRGDLAVSCVVNDRGPYVGDRILDLSRAGSRALGFDGVAQVVVEVLAPVS